MTVHLTEVEMKLLAFCHEHHTGFGAAHSFFISKIRGELALDDMAIRKNVTYLIEHGLLGSKPHEDVQYLTNSKAERMFPMPARRLDRFWLTGNGENFMRALEQALTKELSEAPDAVAGDKPKITTKLTGYVMAVGKIAIEETIKAFVTSVIHPTKWEETKWTRRSTSMKTNFIF